MSDKDPSGFGKFVPGFDFLQNLARGATETLPQIPGMSGWIAPTLNIEDLDKRIQELKAVHFWLDQNSKALAATVQALEVQRMTLATLQGMNVNMGEMANAFKPKPVEKTSPPSKTISEMAAEREHAAQLAAQQAAAAAEPPAPAAPVAPAAPAVPLIDPMQLWGALTTQFQQIAASALQEAGKNTVVTTAMDVSKDMAKDMGKSMSKSMEASFAKPAAPAPAPAKARAKTPAKAAAKKAAPAAKPRAAAKKAPKKAGTSR